MCTLYRCASQDDSDVGELAKEVQLLRDEVNQLKCHYHAISPVFHDDAARAWDKNQPRADKWLCEMDNPYTMR